MPLPGPVLAQLIAASDPSLSTSNPDSALLLVSYYLAIGDAPNLPGALLFAEQWAIETYTTGDYWFQHLRAARSWNQLLCGTAIPTAVPDGAGGVATVGLPTLPAILQTHYESTLSILLTLALDPDELILNPPVPTPGQPERLARATNAWAGLCGINQTQGLV